MIIRTLTMLLLVATLSQASVVLGFNPPGSALVGQAGGTVFWNFNLTNNANYLLIDAVDYLTLTPVGTFTDLFSGIAPVIGPSDEVDGTSSYSIDPPAPPGYLSTGLLEVTYDEYSVSPNDPSFDPTLDLVNSFETASVAASVQVATATPEPGTFGLLLLAGACAGLLRRRLTGVPSSK